MKAAKLLRIRKTGCHAKCTECELYKRDLRSGTLSLRARAQTMDRYTAHIVQQWLDRQVYENMQDLSRSCLSALRQGYMWQASVLASSVLSVIEDGMDQAKFRVPRVLVRSHAFERLLRPALHVQGIWAHGGGYQLASSAMAHTHHFGGAFLPLDKRPIRRVWGATSVSSGETRATHC